MLQMIFTNFKAMVWYYLAGKIGNLGNLVGRAPYLEYAAGSKF